MQFKSYLLFRAAATLCLVEEPREIKPDVHEPGKSLVINSID